MYIVVRYDTYEGPSRFDAAYGPFTNGDEAMAQKERLEQKDTYRWHRYCVESVAPIESADKAISMYQGDM